MSQFTKPEYQALDHPTAVLEDMAAKSGLPFTKIGSLKDDLQKKMLRSWYTNGEDSTADNMIHNAWEKLFGYEFNSKNPDSFVTPMGVLGPPGQGKTSVFTSAMKEIADAMDVKFYVNPNPNDVYSGKITEYDLVFRALILAGEVSTTTLSGIPYSDDNDVTRFNPPAILQSLQRSKFAVMIGDDAMNAHSHIQNALMDIVNTKLFRETYVGEGTYLSITGNLGALDGTNVNKQSSAFANRVEMVLAGDTCGAFLQRAHDMFIDGVDDSFGTCYISDFLIDNVESNPNLFYSGPDKKNRGPHTSSRSLDNLIRTLRDTFADHDAAKNAGVSVRPLFNQIEDICPRYVGLDFSDSFCAYVQDLVTLARPTALELLEYGTLSTETRDKFKDKLLNSDGLESERLAHGFLRQIQNKVTNDIFYGFQQIIPKHIQELNPDMSEDEKKAILKAGGAKAQKGLHAFMEACFGVGMIASGKQNAVMNNIQALCGELIAKSITDLQAKNNLFGKLDIHNQPMVNASFFKKIIDIASKFDKNYCNGEALNVVNKVDGKNVTAMDTCLVDPLSAASQVDQMKKEAEKLGLAM